jgi:hypothetical protein
MKWPWQKKTEAKPVAKEPEDDLNVVYTHRIHRAHIATPAKITFEAVTSDGQAIVVPMDVLPGTAILISDATLKAGARKFNEEMKLKEQTS